MHLSIMCYTPQNGSNPIGSNLNRMPGALGPDQFDYIFNHTGDYLFIIHIQGGASTSFLATVDVELEGKAKMEFQSLNSFFISLCYIPARSKRIPIRDRLPVVGVLRLHVRRLHNHGPRVARSLLSSLARPASDTILDRWSDISWDVGEGHVPGKLFLY